MKEDRIRNSALYCRVMEPDKAADIIKDGMTIGISGFTSSGYPKALPAAIANKVRNGQKIEINLYSGASVGAETDGELAAVGAVKRRFPYQTDNNMRQAINSGKVQYVDTHLSMSPQYVDYGAMGSVDIAIIEAVAITEEGNIIPTTSVGNSATFVKNAGKVIVEINTAMPEALEGMADIFTLRLTER